MLAAWRTSPDRFREDANAEEDLAFGPYRDRLVVELAQNAADAGATSLSLQLTGDVLVAANDGSPLDAAGVRALASLRASSKRHGGTVGRFGVGFASVAAMADEVSLSSPGGGVRFSRADSLELVRGEPALAAELAARSGAVPLLRLPFPAPPSPSGTLVRLVVRPDRLAAVGELLAAADPTLLLVLPGLRSLTVGDRELTSVVDGPDVVVDGSRWRVASGSGELDPALLAGRPVEERSSTRWVVTWAVPVAPSGLPEGMERVVRAPTPTDDPMSLPALLSASLPLGPDRRRVLRGPLTSAVLAEAADVLAGLVCSLDEGPQRLALVPGPLAAGELDADLCRAVLAALRDSPVLPRGVRPADGLVLAGAGEDLVAHLADLLPQLVPGSWSTPRHAAALNALGVPRHDLAWLTEVLAGVDREPRWWGALYALLPPDRDLLGALPVPLSDGRLAPSPRGLVLSGGEDLTPLGLRSVHPDAAHPLLVRLGAAEAEPRALLEDPRVRAAVEALDDDEDADPQPVVAAVLSLVGAAGLGAGDLPWLAALPLPAEDGSWRPAGELLLPHGRLSRVVDLTAGFGVVRPDVAAPSVLAAVGVLADFAVVPAADAADADGVDEWLSTLEPGQEPEEVVRDLDLVRPDAWVEALELLAGQDLLRLPYVRWWLARHPVAGGVAPRDLRDSGAEPALRPLFDQAPPGLPGARRALVEVLREDPDGLFDRLATRPLTRLDLRLLYAGIAGFDGELPPPARLPAVLAGAVVVLDAEDVVVVDRPDLLARTGPYGVLPCPVGLAGRLADALDVALASEVVASLPLPAEGGLPWSEVADLGMLGVDAPAGLVVRRERLAVPDASGQPVPVDWVAGDGVDHVVGPAALARALAWRAGCWERRHELAARLVGGPDDSFDLDRVPGA